MKNRSLTTVILFALGYCMAFAQKFSYTGDDGIEYKFKVISKTNNVELTSASNNKLLKMVIPSTVSYKGKEYSVTKISKGSLGGCDEKLRELVFPNTIKEIEKDIFMGGKPSFGKGLGFGLAAALVAGNIASADIRSLRIGNNIEDIASGAFYLGDKNLKAYIDELPKYISPSMAEKFGLDKQCVQEYWDRVNGTTTPAVQKEVVYVQAPQQSVSPTQQAKPKAPSSDVDTDIPTVGGDNNSTFAVIIANENYQEEVKVDYALNDGEMFKQYCIKVLGLPEKNIHIRKDATLNNLKAEMSWLKQVAEAYGGEARIIVFYAGHGVPDEKSGTSYLLPVDGKGTMLDTGYSLQQFYKQLGDMPSSGVTVFMDACFSGSKRGNGMLASARGIAIKAKPQAPQGKMVVFSAAQGDETAYPYKEKEHGLFTYYLLKKLKETRGNVSLEELGKYVTEQVKRESIVSNGKSQTPSVSTSAAVGNTWKSLKLK